MKKLNAKLSLNKQTLASLDDKQLSAVKGGFTYSLSMGGACQGSRAAGASGGGGWNSPYACGYIEGMSGGYCGN